MKLRRILAGLWIVLLLLVGTCYAENTENPIVFDYGDVYYRLNLPSVEKTEYLGHYFIKASYTKHSLHSIPFVGPYATEDFKANLLIDPSVNKSLFRKWSEMFYHYQELDNVDLAIYNSIKERFPKLCDEVKADNQIADAKYKADIDKAEAAYNNGDWDTAYAMLKKVYDNGCQSESILENLARSSRELGDYDAVIDWESKWIDLFSSAAAYNARARDYYLLGKNDLALADVNWALMKDKNNAKFLDTRGGIYYEMKQYDKAIKDFDAAVKINDKYAHAYYYRGKCYEALGKKDNGKSDYKKAKKYDLEITDDKADFEKQRSRALERKQQVHYQKLEKYKEDLKKLNDAVSVHNNAANYPTRVVFENDDIIITVTGNIKTNESEQFYQEVIPQEVRTNYESGIYQQQYEQLKAQVEAEQAAQQEQQRATAKANGIKTLYRAADVQAYNNKYKNYNKAKFNYDLSKNIYVHLLKRPILLRYVTQPFVTTHNDFDFVEAVAGYFENVSDKAISFYLDRVAFAGEKYEDLDLEMDKTTAKFWEWYRKVRNGEIDAKGILLDKGYFEVTLMPHDRLPFIIKFNNSDFPNGKWTSDMEKKTIDVHCEAMVDGYIFYTNEDPESWFSDITESTLLWGGYDKSSYEEVLKIVDDAFANE